MLDLCDDHVLRRSLSSAGAFYPQLHASPVRCSVKAFLTDYMYITNEICVCYVLALGVFTVRLIPKDARRREQSCPRRTGADNDRSRRTPGIGRGLVRVSPFERQHLPVERRSERL
jgi:hypothetical protein